MTDRELLEAAAKAAGIVGQPVLTFGGRHAIRRCDAFEPWNPLTDDGDALRLAVLLGMEVYHADDDGWFAYASHPTARGTSYAIEAHKDDPYAATRRAIVRAAAAMVQE